VPGIGIHVVLVSIETLAVLLGPARILVFLPVFRRIFLPGPGRLAGLHILIFVTAITLLGNRNNRRINHLAAASDVALRFQMLAKTLEQFFNETGLRKRLPEQPKRRAVGNAVLDAEPQKPRGRQAVAHLILNLFVGQIVKRLQHQHPKHNNDINRLAAGVALLFSRRRQCRRLNLGAEALERHSSSHFPTASWLRSPASGDQRLDWLRFALVDWLYFDGARRHKVRYLFLVSSSDQSAPSGHWR